MKFSYDLLANSTSDDEVSHYELRRRETRSVRQRIGILVALIATASIFLLLASAYLSRRHEPIPIDYAVPISIDVVWRRFWWKTEYSSPNRAENDVHWDAILPSHGIVAVDKAWAAESQWPRSLELPGDPSKMTYLLEAYHQLHCLRIIRKTFWEAVDGRPFTYHPDHHIEHCFDTLRQSVQCNADSTPLYSFGDFTAGDGQLHQCRSWDQLRDWATQHTACYQDSISGIPLKDHFGVCDDGDDGVKTLEDNFTTI